MYSPLVIANFFLQKYSRRSVITPMKLTKLVYIAHGWYLAIKGRSLIDENPEAWMYGPVIPKVYHRFKSYGGGRIVKSFTDDITLDSDADEVFIDKIWTVYGKFSGAELSAMTHAKGTPWSKTWNSIKQHSFYSLQIPEQEIKRYYESLLEKNKAIAAS